MAQFDPFTDDNFLYRESVTERLSVMLHGVATAVVGVVLVVVLSLVLAAPPRLAQQANPTVHHPVRAASLPVNLSI